MAKLVYTRLQDHPRETYFATSGSLIVGRIDCICAGPPAAEHWMWGMQLDIGATPFRRGATVSSREEATAGLEAAWRDWKLWAGLKDSEAAEPTSSAIVEQAIKVLP
jgi:hypothetical protein